MIHPIIFRSLFALSLLITIFSPILLPSLKLAYLAPLMAWTLYKKNTLSFLSYSLLAGFLLDLLSASPFGLWSINYLLSAIALLYFKPFFFADKFFTLPLVTLIFSVISTLIYAFSQRAFFQAFEWSLLWVLTDLIVYPLGDALYALVAFTLPLKYLEQWLPRRRRDVKAFRLVKE